MELIFEKVLERDIDLLMINKFVTDKNILELFLKKINKQGYKVFNIQHSLMDQKDGESDITVIVEKDNHKIGLLIEDKIDAIAMPNQRNRYNARGRKGIDNNQYDDFFVFMIAPNDYLKSNSEAQLYENQIYSFNYFFVVSYIFFVTLAAKSADISFIIAALFFSVIVKRISHTRPILFSSFSNASAAAPESIFAYVFANFLASSSADT